MATCNRLDLQTLGSQLVMPKNLPDHCTTLEGPMEYVIQLNFIKSFLPLTNESSCSSCWDRRATSHTRLRARDHYTSSTLIGGKGRASPSLLQTWYIWGTIIWMHNGRKVYMDSYTGIEWIMFHGHLDYFPKPPLEGRPNTKLGDHGTLKSHNCWFTIFYHVWGPAWIANHSINTRLRRGHIWLHTKLEGHDRSTRLWRCIGTTFGHLWVALMEVASHTSQESWPWNCESPKQGSKDRPETLLNSRSVLKGPQV